MVVGNKETDDKISSTAVLATITRGYPVGKPLELTIAKVRREICREPSLTDIEIIDFLNFCQAEQLNPFRKQIYLVKIPGQTAYYVIAIQSYLQMAEGYPAYQGYKAGVAVKVKATGELKKIVGELYDGDTETLKGGWAEVIRKDRKDPILVTVNLDEYIKRTKEGRATHFWEDQKAGMIRKIALSKVLREAFPNRFNMSITDAEYEVVSTNAITSGKETNQLEEFTLPEPFMKDNEVEWRKVYAKLKEMGITHDDACMMLNIKSIKDDWIGKGESIGDFVETVAELLTKRGVKISAKQEEEKAAIINKETGEITEKPDDIIFPETTAPAAKPEEKIEGPKLDLDWAYSHILELQKAKNPEVEPAKLKERFMKVYHLQEGVCKSVKMAMANLVDPYTGEFADWLSKL